MEYTRERPEPGAYMSKVRQTSILELNRARCTTQLCPWLGLARGELHYKLHSTHHTHHVHRVRCAQGRPPILHTPHTTHHTPHTTHHVHRVQYAQRRLRTHHTPRTSCALCSAKATRCRASSMRSCAMCSAASLSLSCRSRSDNRSRAWASSCALAPSADASCQNTTKGQRRGNEEGKSEVRNEAMVRGRVAGWNGGGVASKTVWGGR